MNDQSPADPEAKELQFEEAEYAVPTAAEPRCATCQQAIFDHYFQVNGTILCERCSTFVKARFTGGSALNRFVKACFYGFGAAIVGFAIYFGVLKLTGMEIGLISILVGFMVGTAVQRGSEGRGGWPYQLTAVFFTYLAIAVSYSAVVIPQMFHQLKAEKAAAAQPKNAGNAEVKEAVEGGQDAEQVAEKVLTPFELLIGIAFLSAFMLALPVLSGFSQPIGLAIVAFALWEAYKLNRKVIIVITGPHNVGPTPDQAPAHA